MKVKLWQLAMGEKGQIVAVGREKTEFCDRLRSLGFTEGGTVSLVGRSPLGDPGAYGVRGAVIALRKEDASLIEVLPMEEGRG